MPGGVTTTRTLTNVSGRRQTFQVRTTHPSGVDIRVSPSHFSLASGASRTLTITISAPSTADGWYFGQITIDPQRHGANSAVLPVAFNRAQGKVTLSHTCADTTLARDAATTCTVTATNLAPAATNATLDVKAPDRVHISNVSAPGVPAPAGFHWAGTLSAALAPTIESITPGDTIGGYLALSGFGVPAEPGFADETIVEYDVPPFEFGSETYDKIGVDSNGYLVVGGGDAGDNECCNVQTFPDPARPNNVLAPYWTDLDLSAGGGVRLGLLSDGVNDFLIVEWTGAPAWTADPTAGQQFNTFQIWITLGATEGISYTYGELQGPSDALNVGAENRDGSSGVNLVGGPVLPEYTITTAPPLPGGSVTITYKASASRRGTYFIPASLTSDIVRGTSIRTVRLSVH
jgi:hypothetical protein